MDYFINPMWFYWIGVISSIDWLLPFFAALTIIITFTIFYNVMENWWFVDNDDYQNREANRDKMAMKTFFIGCLSFVLICVISIITPSENTMYKMVAASLTTTENYEMVKGEMTDLFDYINEDIINIINETKGE